MLIIIASARACCRVVRQFNNRVFYLLDEDMTWDEARDRCRQGHTGYLAVANTCSVQEFDFLRKIYDVYRAAGGKSRSVWIDGRFDPVDYVWRCLSNADGLCRSGMPWAEEQGGPANCVLIWGTYAQGVTNAECNSKMSAICATHRYVICLKLFIMPVFLQSNNV